MTSPLRNRSNYRIHACPNNLTDIWGNNWEKEIFLCLGFLSRRMEDKYYQEGKDLAVNKANMAKKWGKGGDQSRINK
jgi:hypothetical protein